MTPKPKPEFWTTAATLSSVLFFAVSWIWLFSLFESLVAPRWYDQLAMGLAATAFVSAEATFFVRAIRRPGWTRPVFLALSLFLAALAVVASSVSVLSKFDSGDSAKASANAPAAALAAQRVRLQAQYDVELGQLQKASGDSYKSPEATRAALADLAAQLETIDKESSAGAVAATPEASRDLFGALRVVAWLRGADIRTLYALLVALAVEACALASAGAAATGFAGPRKKQPGLFVDTKFGSHAVREIRADGALLTECGRVLEGLIAEKAAGQVCPICRNALILKERRNAV